MCKEWILNPVRTMLRTKSSQGNYSPLTRHNMINIALFTAQNTYALLEQTRWWRPCITCLRSYSSCVESLLTIASVLWKLSSIESLFPCSSRSSSSYASVHCRSICVLRSSIRKVPWLRHIRIGIEQILRPLIHHSGTSVSGLPDLAAV